MNFSEYLNAVLNKLYPFNPHCSSIKTLLDKNSYNITDLGNLLSVEALDKIEILAKKASELNLKQFGRAVSLFTPLYISNYCSNSCLYCSFSALNKIERKQLLPEEIDRETTAISEKGVRHILVLTGESSRITTFEYLKNSLEQISGKFSSTGIEVYPLREDEYGDLIKNNLIDSLTIYQETYNKKLYKKLHQKGPKSDFEYRLETPDRACRQGIHSLTIGGLLGLDNFKREALSLALHVEYLQSHYPETELIVSFPRIRPQEGEYTPEYAVSDRELTLLVIAFRLMFPSVGITMSTREPQKIRDGLIPLGVTKVSAGVSTSVGRNTDNESSPQFEIADSRSVAQMCEALKNKGYQPVMHNWNLKLTQV